MTREGAGAEVPSPPLGPSEGRPGGANGPSGSMALHAIAVAAGMGLAALLLGRGGSPVAAGFAALWWVPVVVVVRSDLERFVIPDEASLAIAALGLGYAAAGTPAGSGPAATVAALAAAGLNGALAFGLFWLIGQVYRARSGRTGLGFGDVKLAGASALWLAPSDGAAALEIAALAGLALALAGRRKSDLRDVAVPFGAVLAPAAWLVFVAGPSVRAALDPLS